MPAFAKENFGPRLYPLAVPEGPASFPKLDKPDATYSRYSCNVRFKPDDKRYVAFREKLEKWVEEAVVPYFTKINGKKGPLATGADLRVTAFEEERDKDKELTGYHLVRASMKATRGKPPVPQRPKVYDSRMEEILPVPPIWGGSVVRLSVSAKSVFVPGQKAVFVKLELLGAQVIKLVNSLDPSEALGAVEDGYVFQPAGTAAPDGEGDLQEDYE